MKSKVDTSVKKPNITFETLQELNKNLFRPSNSENNGDNKENTKNINDLLKEMGVEPNKDNTKNIDDLLKEMVVELNKDNTKNVDDLLKEMGVDPNKDTKNIDDLLKEMGVKPKKDLPKKDKNKKYISADELIRGLNARAEDNREINEKLKEYHAKEAQRASEEVEKFNKMINDNLDMSSEKSEIINRLIELYSLRQIYYLNKIDNNLKANEKIDNDSISREKTELEKRLRDQHKKGSGMFTSQK